MAKRPRTEPRVQSYSERIVDTRGILPSFLIICEGKKTEPNYFQSFRIPTLSVETWPSYLCTVYSYSLLVPRRPR